MWRTLKTLAIAGVAAGIGGLLFAWSGLYSVAASKAHWTPVEMFFEMAMRRSVERHAASVGEPPDLNDPALVRRGAGHYEDGCAPCHGALGDGNGITKQYGMGATPTYHDERLRNVPEGEIYNVITHGKGNMLPDSDKLSPEDRWAVILYVRTLQRAQMGTPADVADAAARTSLGIQ